MKKKLFMALLIMVLSLLTLSLSTVKAATNLEFVSDGKSTIEKTNESTIYTLVGSETRSLLTLDVSQMGLDKSNVFLSVQYKFTGNVEGFEVYVNEKSDATFASVAVKDSSVPLSDYNWNLVKHEVTDNYVISTINISSVTSKVEALNSVIIRLKGNEKNIQFELFDFAINADGTHNFSTSVGQGSGDSGDDTPSEPDTPSIAFPTEFVFKSNSSKVVVEGNLATITVANSMRYSNLYTEFNPITDLSNIFVSIMFKATNISELQFVVWDSTGSQDSGHYAYSGRMLPNASDHVSLTEYSDFTVATVKMSSDISTLSDMAKIAFNINASEAGATLEILNFAITADGKHGWELPELPMEIGGMTAENRFTVEKNENNETVVSYPAHEGENWYTVDFQVSNYKQIKDQLILTFTSENAVFIGVQLNSVFKGGHNLYSAQEKHTVTIDLSKYGTLSENNTVKMYFDAQQSGEANEVTFHSIQFKSSLIPDLELTVEDQAFDYTGSPVSLEVGCNADVELTYEYKLEGSSEWLVGMPAEVGSYLVRVSYQGTDYESEPVEAKVVITKVVASAPAVDAVTYDAHTRVVTIKDGIEASLDPEFVVGEEVYNGDVVLYGTVIYYRTAGNDTYLPSEALSLKVVKHAVDSEWSKNEENHWHECECGMDLDLAAHNWGEGVVTTAPTCTLAGVATYTCTICGQAKTAVVESTGHTAVTDAAVAATCTTTGLTEGSHCGVCNEVLVAQEVVPVAEHTAVTDAAVAATCTLTGLTEGSHCGVCNEVLVAQETVAALGHTAVTDAAVAATCAENGLTEGSHCGVCNEVLVAQEKLGKVPHVDNDTDYTCDVCNTVLASAKPDAPAPEAPENQPIDKLEDMASGVVDKVTQFAESVGIGCAGSVAGTLFSLIALCGAVVFFKNRKNKEE